jgi:hypothetical protein
MDIKCSAEYVAWTIKQGRGEDDAAMKRALTEGETRWLFEENGNWREVIRISSDEDSQAEGFDMVSAHASTKTIDLTT